MKAYFQHDTLLALVLSILFVMGWDVTFFHRRIFVFLTFPGNVHLLCINYSWHTYVKVPVVLRLSLFVSILLHHSDPSIPWCNTIKSLRHYSETFKIFIIGMKGLVKQSLSGQRIHWTICQPSYSCPLIQSSHERKPSLFFSFLTGKFQGDQSPADKERDGMQPTEGGSER